MSKVQKISSQITSYQKGEEKKKKKQQQQQQQHEQQHTPGNREPNDYLSEG